MQEVSFQKTSPTDFHSQLRNRVAQYFQQHKLNENANATMVTKSLVIYSIAFGAYGLIIANILPLTISWFLCAIMGVSFAALGMAVAHDSIHGAYSSNKIINYILGYTLNIIGGNRYVWSITHNVVHHAYTNVHDVDEDLELAPFIRLSPFEERKKIHRYQHFLAFIAYAFATIFWVFVKDYKKMSQRDIGPYKNKKHPWQEWVLLFVFKIIYYSYMIVIPLLIFTWWQWLIGFLTLHFVCGTILGITFQMAHTVENTDHAEDLKAMNEQAWAIFQMKTTSNFAMKSKLLTWYMGGLNYQVEHHLFPKTCSVHYPAISKIVKQTADEYHVPYHSNPTFASAIASHYKFLKRLGREN
ncbi:MAG TPA: acyl-CoA desaturase [Chitinophagales bacterium]|nr:acyl-CoA desaturase [Chitinophagales bacterium]